MNPSADSDGRLERLAREVEELSRRVAALEGHAPPEEPGDAADGMPVLAGISSTADLMPQAARSMPLFGRALLGLAGAYILRALTEAGTLPAGAGVFIAVCYAAWWLVLAVRAPQENRLVVIVDGLTAVFVLYPMLWEATVRFRVLPPVLTAGVLGAFALLGFGIAWHRERSPVTWITTIAALATTVALLVATHDLLTFTTVLLVISASIEFSACRDHWLGLRWAVAVTADLFVLLLMYLVTKPGGMPESYPPVAQTAMLAILGVLLTVYLSSTVVRTLFRRLPITVFEIGQVAVSFLILIGGVLRISQGAGTASMAMAALLLCAGAACYLVAFAFLDRRTGHDINFYAYSTFGMLLVFAGIRILLGEWESWRAVAWSALAVAGSWMGSRAGRDTLHFHGLAYQLFAVISSGLAAFSFSRLMRVPQPDAVPPAVLLLPVAAAAVCYLLFTRDCTMAAPQAADNARGVLFLAGAWWGGAGLIHWAALRVLGSGGMRQTPSLAATCGTFLMVLSACGMAWGAGRWKRREMGWLVYPVMILCGYKILTLDMPESRSHAVSVSLLLYGAALLLLPRLLRREIRRS